MTDFNYDPTDQEALDAQEAQRPSLAALAAAQQAEAEIVGRFPLLVEREHIHGDFLAVALTAQRLKDVAKCAPNWVDDRLTCGQRESLESIFTKIARILSGDPNHRDSWEDIIGYAQLVIEQLR